MRPSRLFLCGSLTAAVISTAPRAVAACKVETEPQSYDVSCTGEQFSQPVAVTPPKPLDRTSLTITDLSTFSLSAMGRAAAQITSTAATGSDYGNQGGSENFRSLVLDPGVAGFRLGVSGSATAALWIFSKSGGGGRTPASGGPAVAAAPVGEELGTTNVYGRDGGGGGLFYGGGIAVDGVDVTADGPSAIQMSMIGGNGGDGEGKTAQATKGQRPHGGAGGYGGAGVRVNKLDLGDTAISRGASGTDAAPTILVETRGGNGGNGGTGKQPNIGGATGIGGPGGTGGSGGDVLLTLDSVAILSKGSRASGIVLRSGGGRGGNGGAGDATNSTGSGTAPADGGTAGRGGAGRAVTVRNSGSLKIQTVGAEAFRAESVGGLGGTGGTAKGQSGKATGGNGGQGGAAGTVDVELGTDVDIALLPSPGLSADPIDADSVISAVVARSLGGAGGDGGRGNGFFNSKGGNAAGPGPAGNVSVFGGGDVRNVAGEDFNLGILAQSVGGFAGTGGSASGNSVVAYGGSTTSGGDGKKVIVDWDPASDGTGLIETDGDFSEGIVAQSVGGGGGKGGSITGTSGNLFSAGGSGEAAGAGGVAQLRILDGVTVKTSGDNSTAAMVHSIGGGGGTGGTSKGFVKVGGSGSGGGAGGEVLLDFRGAARTTGFASRGVHVQSIGGGGGSASDISNSFSVVNIGGEAKGGGGGGGVQVFNEGSVATEDGQSAALLIESTGGGGGTASGATTGSVGFAVNLGGNAGGGGSGGPISYSELRQGADTSPAEITTTGQFSPALTLLSQGGGGGLAGANASGAASVAWSVEYTAGGSGGDGGSGGAVGAALGGTYRTGGDMSYGALVASTGGGGGVGGNAISAGGALLTNVDIALGGSGGAGGGGGAVTVDSAATIATSGDNAFGLAASSTGGGGGSSGQTVSAGASSIEIGIAVGGSAGGGGNGGAVSLGHSGSIETSGENAPGLNASSTAGGGGDANVVVNGGAGPFNFQSTHSGSGGGGGKSGAVTVTATGDVTTHGSNSEAIRAYSQAGGGGAARGSVGAGFGLASVGYSLGGDGGKGGIGGNVMVSSSGDIVTEGDNSYGIDALSTGGAGGSVGFAGQFDVGVVGVGVNIGGDGGSGGRGGDVGIDLAGTITTRGENAFGVSATSTGKSGGRSGTSLGVGCCGIPVPIGIGGDGGSGGRAGDVTVTKTTGADGTQGLITTEGANAPALYASSIGGDGGRAAVTLSASGSTGGGGPKDRSGSASVAIGGSGGAGGVAGDVTVESAGGLGTAGPSSPALAAESTGGNGGAGGVAIAGSANVSGYGNVAVAVGGSGGSGGDAGAVSVTSEDTIATGEELSPGIAALSQGGAGGHGAFSLAIAAGAQNQPPKAKAVVNNLAVSVGGSGGDGGKAAAVSVAHAGDLTTKGDQSLGVSAMSIGGNGGYGGVAVSGAATVVTSLASNPASTSDAVAISVGGGGGKGSVGRDVTLVEGEGEMADAFMVRTEGDRSPALDALSQGGSGGIGGMTLSGTLATNNIDISVGGSGGDAGRSGTVGVINHATLTTLGQDAPGIQARSQGGAGGTGGISISGQIAPPSADNFKANVDVAVSIGGAGGDGGASGNVRVDNFGAVSTGDYSAPGIVAMSRGGDGGSGGGAWVGVLDVAKKEKKEGTNDFNIDVSVGGAGGAGGTSGTVDIANGGAITTTGQQSEAIFAQSMGGNGGAGGGNHNLFILYDGANRQAKYNVNVGGSGGLGGLAKGVTVTNTAALSTEAPGSDGIYAESVGGNGGKGGVAANMNLGFTPKVWSATAPATEAASNSSDAKLDISVSVGGAGGGGAIGGPIDVTNSGDITTGGDLSRGIFGQSVGGNGGDGGSATVFNLKWGGICKSTALTSITSAWAYNCFANKTTSEVFKDSIKKVELKANVLIGGAGGKAAHANTVTIENHGGITTEGVAADAIYAQSQGGGGGTGGNAGAGNLDPWIPDEETEWARDVIDIVQFDLLSELKPTSWDVVVGGTGGASGDGKAVDVTNSGSLIVSGEGAFGIDAISSGGGGGKGGVGQSRKMLWVIAVDGSGSGGGTGGPVTVANAGAITSSGDNGLGIFAQSVGGGGGSAGDIQAAPYIGGLVALPGSLSPFVFFQGSGAGGDGGDVAVTSSGPITTHGGVSTGIFAQSTGGGGGAQGQWKSDLVADFEDNVLIPWRRIGSNGFAGSAGDVAVTVSAPVTVTGEGSVGIFAQSAGGSKGLTEEKNLGGAVDLNVKADVTASGEKSRAILAQSLGGIAAVYGTDEHTVVTGDANGTIDITIAKGTTVAMTNPEGFEAIGIMDGNGDSRLINRGTIYGASEEYGAVSVLRSYQENAGFLLENRGTIRGGLQYRNTAQEGEAIQTRPVFDNYGLLELGDSLLDYVTLNNYGTVTAGAAGAIARTELNAKDRNSGGSFLSLDSKRGVGTIQVDYQFGDRIAAEPDADLLRFIDLEAKVVDSVIQPVAVGLNLIGNGTSGEFKIAEGDQFYLDAKVSDDAIVDWGLRYVEGSTISTGYLTYEMDTVPWEGFAGGSYDQTLTDGQRKRANANLVEIGTYIDELVARRRMELDDRFAQMGLAARKATTGGSGGDYGWVEPLTTYLLNVQDIGDLIDIYESWTPQVAAAPLNTALFSAIDFANGMTSCPDADALGAKVDRKSGRCLWFRAGRSGVDRDATSAARGFNETATGFDAGLEVQARDDLTVSAALSYEDASLDGAGGAGGSGRRYLLGATIQRESGPLSLSASLEGGISDYDLSRRVMTPDGAATARSNLDGKFLAAWLRAARTFTGSTAAGTAYLKPTLNLGVVHQWQDGYREKGAGEFGARVGDVDQTFLAINPFLEAGGQFQDNEYQIAPFVRIGVLGLVGNPATFDVAFDGVPRGGPSFAVQQDVPDLFADLALGLEIQQGDISARFGGRALFADTQQNWAADARITFRF